jgi:uncharacterized iron-regulated membrane protein
MTLRKMLLTVHLVIGLAAAPLLALLGATGLVLAFEDPLDHALNAPLLDAPGAGPLLSPGALERRLGATHPGYRVESLSIPADEHQAWTIQLGLAVGEEQKALLVDPHDGSVLGEETQLDRKLTTVHQLHTRLLAGPWGRALVGYGGVALVALALSGLILWWPGKILRVRRNGSRRRLVFELHSALGGVTWAMLLVFGVSAIGIHWNGPILSALAWVTGETLPPPFPDSAPGCAGQPALPLSRIITAARAAVPGARLTTARIGDGDAPARVIFKFPEDHTPAGRTNVFVAACSGAVIDARSSRTAPVAYRAMALWNREIHTGDLGGWPTRVLAALVSLTLPIMALTGPIIWWQRRGRQREHSAKKAGRQAEE